MTSVNISELENIDDYPDDAEFILDDISPRYIFAPEEMIEDDC